MTRAVIGLAATALVFSVVSFWILRTEPTIGPLLAVPTPVESAVESRERKTTSNDREFRHRGNDAEAAPPALPESAALAQLTEKRREQVRQLVRQLRPQQSDPAIEVWVEEFGHLNDDEIAFLLNQSTLFVGAGTARTESSAAPDELPVVAPGLRDDRGRDPRGATARMNLRNSMTIGYRDRLELTVLSAGETPDPQRVSLRRFTSGEAFETNDPLHVALQTPGLVFFQLADGRLTRNGMFARMDDGHLGLKAGDNSVALRDSPVVSDHHRCEILSDGHVMVAGNSNPVGRIRVVSVEHGDWLTTEDGVYFRTKEDAKPAEQFVLQPRAVELSNVNVELNRHVLNALQSH